MAVTTEKRGQGEGVGSGTQTPVGIYPREQQEASTRNPRTFRLSSLCYLRKARLPKRSRKYPHTTAL